jgi:hypothetical protein
VTDRVAEPLLASELLVRRMMLRTTTGAGFVEVEDVQVAAELASITPSSWQYALALAEIAHAGSWTGDPETVRHADTALAIARASGNPRALCYALTASSIVAIDDGRPEAAVALATEAVDPALAARDWSVIPPLPQPRVRRGPIPGVAGGWPGGGGLPSGHGRPVAVSGVGVISASFCYRLPPARWPTKPRLPATPE